jgi:hypothetical protein
MKKATFTVHIIQFKMSYLRTITPIQVELVGLDSMLLFYHVKRLQEEEQQRNAVGRFTWLK